MGEQIPTRYVFKDVESNTEIVIYSLYYDTALDALDRYILKTEDPDGYLYGKIFLLSHSIYLGEET